MAHPFSLEHFDTMGSTIVPDNAQIDPSIAEAQKLNVFEKGYKAGWDDSAAALVSEHQRISADFAANLSDLSFTYFEARVHILQGIESLVKEVFCKILPETARVALPQLVWEEVSGLLERSSSSPLKILIAPGCRSEMEAIFPPDPGFPLEIIEEPTLSEGQVFLRCGDVERVIDISGALSDIETGITDFFSSQKGSLKANG